MNKLYNKVKILNRINNPPRLRANQKDTTWAQPGAPIVKGFLKLLMSLKNVTGSYSERGRNFYYQGLGIELIYLGWIPH